MVCCFLRTSNNVELAVALRDRHRRLDLTNIGWYPGSVFEFRVQIGFYKRDLQRVDLNIGDRLARVVAKEEQRWHLEDDHGQRHTILLADNEEPGNSDEGRWVMQNPIPAYWIGEELTLSWRRRNCTAPEERRNDFKAQVIAEDADSVTVKGADGNLHRLLRANGHEFERNTDYAIARDELRWVIVARQYPHGVLGQRGS